MIGRAWMRFVEAFGRVQTTLLLSLVYVVVIGPLWLCVCVLGRRDLLETRREGATSFAVHKPKVPTDRERCERQF
ncbi:MAG: hypothetical protein E4H11_10140 [Myxococcales bacterium]|nr:MAG: hypothetical protein E4H11_10140 [Myxococcales bacterium]